MRRDVFFEPFYTNVGKWCDEEGHEAFEDPVGRNEAKEINDVFGEAEAEIVACKGHEDDSVNE